MVRAQEVRFAWERFVQDLAGPPSGDDDDPELIREPIADSWRRSHAAGVDPTHHLAPVVADRTATWTCCWHEHPLARAAPIIRQCLAATADEAGYLVVVSDADGVLLCIEGSNRIRMRAADSMNFAEGTLWSERRRGHERDRHRARRRPRRPGLRARALQRGRAALDVLGRADPRSRHRPAARRHRPHRRLLDRPPREPRRGHRDRRAPSRPRCGSTLQERDAALRARYGRAGRHGARARARSSPRPAARSPSCPRAGASTGRLAIPHRRRRADAALRRRARSPSPSARRRRLRRARARPPRRWPARCRSCRLTLLGESAPDARGRRPPHRAAPAPGRDPRPARAPTRRASAPRRCAPGCTATAAARAACASRSRGCAS